MRVQDIRWEVDYLSGRGWYAHSLPLAAYAGRRWVCQAAPGPETPSTRPHELHDHLPGGEA